MAKLGVNVDHIATVRQARMTNEPDPVAAAVLAELGGADGITVHLREDRRHIQDRDVLLLRRTAATKLNLEMGLADEIIKIALGTQPDQVTLVPERRQEVTTEGGLDVIANAAKLRETIPQFRDLGIAVSLFIDPDNKQIEASRDVGADAVELHTGRYAEAKTPHDVQAERYQLELSATLAANYRLTVHAGHGLTYRNVRPIATIATFEELNIGHSIVSRATMVGMERAVREMKALMMV